MKTISEPKTRSEDVVDFQAEFPASEPIRVTLHKGDTVKVGEDTIVISMKQPKGIITIERRNLLWHGRHERTIVWPIQEEGPIVQVNTQFDPDQGQRPSPLSVGPLGRLNRDAGEL